MIQDSDSEDELERYLGVYAFGFIVTCVANSSEEEEEEEKEEMLLERKMSLRELLTGKAKGLVLKDASGS